MNPGAMDPTYVLLTVTAMMAVTFALRALPFVAAQWLTRHPFVHRLKEFLPLSIMSLLVLHSGTQAAEALPGPWPVVAAVAVTVIMQWRLRHPLLSMFCGTALFVVLSNRVF